MLDKAYSHEDVESRWTAAWKEAKLFHSKPSDQPSYTIVIPPPNITGALHIGHALNNTLQDILIRYHRLRGREACWVPGTDHGGIATQNVMEKMLKQEGLTRHDLGREKFLGRMQTWSRETKNTILGQLTRLGCALDFSREAFTMDETRAAAVCHAFKQFYDQGLIYRDKRMVNWCVRCGTALSDIEVEHEERKGGLWHIKYPVVGEEGRFLTIATTRPETMLADTAIAVHPDDERYRDLHGKKAILPLVNIEIPIIADAYVDRSFGTGALKVTPYHDVNDFAIWQRHKDVMPAPPQVIGFDGRMTEQAPEKYRGQTRDKARDAVVADLEECGLLDKMEKYKNAVGTCYRCQQAIETLPSEQWFMKMGELAAKAGAAVDAGDFKLYTQSWTKPYRKWLADIHDWCLSRQIWWGHRIPVWYCPECLGDKLELSGDDEYRLKSGGEKLERGVRVAASRPDKCACGADRWVQDADVLDTWFSSALWPLSVFGWPEDTPDLRFYYPTKVLVTGYEILYLWVARMQMMGLYFKDRVPFDDALIHGIVRDNKGKKMSKSLGNVIDPLVMMDKYGTDALRFALAAQAHPGRDIPFSEDSLTGPRHFVNKIWNSTRFVLMNVPETAPAGGYALAELDGKSLELADRWILDAFAAAVERVHAHIQVYNVAAAADELYGFLWDDFCDWYVELAKIRLEDKSADGRAARTILVQVLTATMKLLHPFMPYVTEELYGALKAHAGEKADYILRAGESRFTGELADREAAEKMAFVMGAVRALRALRSQLNVPPAMKLNVMFAGEDQHLETLLNHAHYVRRLARLESFEKSPGERPPQSATAVVGGLTFYVPLAGVIDLAKERKRLAKEFDALCQELARCEKQLGNPSFVERAPAAEVEKIRCRQQDFASKKISLEGTLASLGN
ncbi:MAG: valine--tRNA ligase [Elusimicrobiota bacterium]